MPHIDTPAHAGAPAARAEHGTGHRAGASGALRRLVLRMHFYAGILVGPFLLVAAISGALYAVSPTIEKIAYHDLVTADSAAQVVPLAEQVRTATARHPDLAPSAIVPGVDGASTHVLFTDPATAADSLSPVVFVDPSTGQIRGESVQNGSSQALPLRAWISGLHRTLHLGTPGRIYTELAASWLAPLALGGLYLWWRCQGSIAAMFLPQRRRGATKPRPGTRARVRNRHTVVGSWAALGLLMIAATGLTWSLVAGARIGDVREQLGWTTPKLSASVDPAAAAGAASPSGHAAHAGHAGHGGHGPAESMTTPPDALSGDGIDRVYHAAQQAGLAEPINLAIPQEAGDRWLVKETRRSFNPGPDAVAVDPDTYAVVDRLDFADWPVAAKLTEWGIQLHMGFLFGVANQLLLAVLAIALAVVVIKGYLMWWKRRPSAGGWAPAPQPGALRELARHNPVVLLAGLALLGLCCWLVPLLAASLAAFLVVDVVIGRSRGRAIRAGSETMTGAE